MKIFFAVPKSKQLLDPQEMASTNSSSAKNRPSDRQELSLDAALPK